MTQFKNTLGLLATGVFGFAVLQSSAAQAGPGKIETPYAHKGEIGLEAIGSVSFDDGETEFENEFAIEYGVTDYLKVELAAEVVNEEGNSTEVEAVELIGRFQLTEKDEYFVDVGVEVGFGYSTVGGANEIITGLLLAKDYGEYSWRSNIGFEYEVGEDAEDNFEADISFGGYKEVGDYEVGFEYFGDIGNLGELSGYSDQEHVIGPVVARDFHLPGGQHLEAKLGYLQGISNEAPDSTIKYELELEF